MKLTKAQLKWFKLIEKCGALFKYYNCYGNADYRILNCETEIRTDMAERLIKSGYLKAQNDGLLPGDSQTWKFDREKLLNNLDEYFDLTTKALFSADDELAEMISKGMNRTDCRSKRTELTRLHKMAVAIELQIKEINKWL